MQKSIFTIAQERNISRFLFLEPPVQGKQLSTEDGKWEVQGIYHGFACEAHLLTASFILTASWPALYLSQAKKGGRKSPGAFIFM